MSEVDLSQLAVDRTHSPKSGMRMRRHVWTRYLLPGLLIFGFLSLVGWASRDFIFPPRDVQVIPVMAVEAEMRAEGTALFNAAGWIEPRPTSVRVAALASGVVEKLLVVEDQVLKKGEPVATLILDDAKLAHRRAIADRKLAEAELERAKAMMAAAKTRFEQPVHLLASRAEADSNLAKINTMLKNLPHETERAESRLTYAAREYKRNSVSGVGVSRRELDAAKTAYEQAKAMVDELKIRQGSLEKEATAIKERRDAVNLQYQLLADEIEAKDGANAQVKSAQARVEQMLVAEAEAELRLSRMIIRAPVDGRVYQLIGHPGARVGNGVMTAMDGHDGGTVVTMYQPESLQIRVDVRFEDIPKVQLGQPVRINNPAMKEPILGSVLFVSSEADIQKNTLQVKVISDSPPEFFKPEMLVDVTFLTPKQRVSSENTKHDMRLYLPKQLIGQFEGQPFVWLADQSDGVAQRTFVTTGGEAEGDLIEIEKGLEVGSRVISSSVDGLKNGTKIRVTGESNE